jgi:hypothetical protein
MIRHLHGRLRKEECSLSGKEEQKRLDEVRVEKIPWKKWGPFLSERQWGTVCNLNCEFGPPSKSGEVMHNSI